MKHSMNLFHLPYFNSVASPSLKITKHTCVRDACNFSQPLQDFFQPLASYCSIIKEVSWSQVNTIILALWFSSTFANNHIILHISNPVKSVIHNTAYAYNYIDFCNAAKRKLTRCLVDDIQMALTYDSEMFCFILPYIFGELAGCGSFPVTGNSEIIQMVVSAIDPHNLQELVCLCLTGTAKVINRDEVMPLIGKLSHILHYS